VPSERDRAEASYSGWYVIVGLATVPPEVRAFRFDGQAFVSGEIETTADR
jgi:hypothetical protein